jgi:hypothetical protein
VDLSPVGPPALEGWLPSRVDWRARPPVVEWCRLGDRPFLEPFFEQTLGAAQERPFNRVFQQRTSLDELAAFDPERLGVEPTGFVLHLSRCGSTLLARMLQAVPGCVVLSEPTPLDAVIDARRRFPDLDEARHVAWLRGMVGALARPRRPGPSRVFVKLDAWHVGELPRLRRAFPRVPWVFLYRDPVEVLVSHRRQRGAQMIPAAVDPGRFGLDLASAAALDPDAYAAHVLGCLARSARDALALGGGRLVHYRELPEAAWGPIASHFGVSWSEDDRRRMAEAATRDAKRPDQPFAPDGADKQADADPALRAEAERRVGPLYRELEALRRERPAAPTTAPRKPAPSAAGG